MVITLDPILRFSWSMYILAPGQKQCNSEAFFLIALVEVFRDFLWNFFRAEAGHIANLGHFGAKLDMPLPMSFTTAHVRAEDGKPAQVPETEMSAMKRRLVRLTESVRITHAEDFDSGGDKKETERNGSMPDEIGGLEDKEQGR